MAEKITICPVTQKIIIVSDKPESKLNLDGIETRLGIDEEFLSYSRRTCIPELEFLHLINTEGKRAGSGPKEKAAMAMTDGQTDFEMEKCSDSHEYFDFDGSALDIAAYILTNDWDRKISSEWHIECYKREARKVKEKCKLRAEQISFRPCQNWKENYTGRTKGNQEKQETAMVENPWHGAHLL